MGDVYAADAPTGCVAIFRISKTEHNSNACHGAGEISQSTGAGECVCLVGDDMGGAGAERDWVDLGRGAGRGRRPVTHALETAYAVLGGGGGSAGAEEWSKWSGWELLDRRAGGGVLLSMCAGRERPLLDPCEWSDKPPAWDLRRRGGGSGGGGDGARGVDALLCGMRSGSWSGLGPAGGRVTTRLPCALGGRRCSISRRGRAMRTGRTGDPHLGGRGIIVAHNCHS